MIVGPVWVSHRNAALKPPDAAKLPMSAARTSFAPGVRTKGPRCGGWDDKQCENQQCSDTFDGHSDHNCERDCKHQLFALA
tara:strand:- start:330 stop:572 length:243 start_codon:yes stop_codon:yes gene_type:complete